jgi:hypothetical protein
MDGYPVGSLDHNVPLLVASGLNDHPPELSLPETLQEQAIELRSELPSLETREAKALEEYFAELDTRGKSWVGVERDDAYRFRIKPVGRVCHLRLVRARAPATWLLTNMIVFQASTTAGASTGDHGAARIDGSTTFTLLPLESRLAHISRRPH